MRTETLPHGDALAELEAQTEHSAEYLASLSMRYLAQREIEKAEYAAVCAYKMAPDMPDARNAHAAVLAAQSKNLFKIFLSCAMLQETR